MADETTTRLTVGFFGGPLDGAVRTIPAPDMRIAYPQVWSNDGRPQMGLHVYARDAADARLYRYQHTQWSDPPWPPEPR